jgi:P27 family predicted phage terminase small subunit
MKPGPVKTPTALRVMRGNPSKRPFSAKEPKPAAGAPKPSKDLPPEAAAEWRAVVADLATVPGLLTRADRAVLELYARTMARYRQLEAFVQANGPVLVMRDERGQVRYAQPCPQASLAAKLLPQLRALAAELGLSPASRTRIELPKAPADDELSAFLRKA